MANSGRYFAKSSIKGGLPVWVEVTHGHDYFTNEYYAEIQAIFWQKRDGSIGKEITGKVYDQAEKYEPGLYSTLEVAEDWIAMESNQEPDTYDDFFGVKI